MDKYVNGFMYSLNNMVKWVLFRIFLLLNVHYLPKIFGGVSRKTNPTKEILVIKFLNKNH